MGNALRAVASVFSVTRVAIGGATAAVGAFATAVNEGHNQSIELAKTLALTRNAAGMTEGKFNSLAKTIAEATNTTIGSSRGTAQGLVGSGRFSGAALEETAKAAQLMSKVTGASSEDVVKHFVTMTDGVAKWADTANRSYHFLTTEQMKYIKSLEDQGNAQKAIEVTMEALNTRLGQAAKNLGILEGAWNAVRRAASSTWDAMAGVGRELTLDDQIAQLQKKIESTNKTAGGLTGLSSRALAAFNQQANAELTALRTKLKAQEDSAKASEKEVQTEQAKISFEKLRELSLSKQQKLTKEIAEANALADRAGLGKNDRARL